MEGYYQSDITILGAGPAGTTAAISLAKKGIPSLLIDKTNFPRPKICGDGLSGKVIGNLKRLDPDLTGEIRNSGLATDSGAARFFAPNRKMAELSFKPDDPALPAGLICSRIDFDDFLLRKALTMKEITFSGGNNIEKIYLEDGVVTLQNQEGRIVARTRLLLFAAGSDKRMIRLLDPGYAPNSEEGIGIRAYFENVAGSDHKNAIEIHFFKELLPWYFWIFPFNDGSANVGLALPESIAKKNSMSLKELLQHIPGSYPDLRSRFKGAKMKGRPEAARLAFYTGPCKIAGDHYLLLGDAARLIDPFTGEGVGNAMSSGRFAAEIAAECMAGGNFTQQVTGKYQEMVESKLVPELALSLKLQSLARYGSLLNLVIGRASANEKTRDLISEMLYNPDVKKRLSKPGFYIKMLLGS